MSHPSAGKGPITRCGGCGQAPHRVLRRGRCERCYDVWVRSRPIGLGATCGACDDRRRIHLRHYELGLKTNAPGGRWVVLCHNCIAFADSLNPPPRSVEALKMRLHRDRRFGDRRAESVGPGYERDPSVERRGGDRRESLRDLPEMTEDVVEIIAEYEQISEDRLTDLEEVTGIHAKLSE
jgi:hypothetical protein